MTTSPLTREHELIKIKISDIRLDKANPNQMSREQMAGLRESMNRWGYLTPIIIDQNNLICDGEHRLLVYKELGYEEIPAYQLDLKDDTERRILRQVMNKLRGEHNRQLDSNELLEILQQNRLTELSTLIAQQQFDLQQVIRQYHPDVFFEKPEGDFDLVKELEDIVPTTQLGDLYQLGNHRLICADCSDKRSLDKLLEDKQLDLTVTSPPYDDLREYGTNNSNNFEFESIAKELYQITCQNGVVVWIVGDSTTDGNESLTSFKQALYFQSIDFNVHDTMIYVKNAFAKPANNRYHQTFEYMFVLSKGTPKTFNPLKDRQNKEVDAIKRRGFRQTNGSMEYTDKYITIQDFGMRFNVWLYDIGYMHMTSDKIAYEHPAIFPLDLAKDHIQSWSNPNDLVFDPFCGSGTTLIASEQLNRKCYAVEIDPHYCDVIVKRWEQYTEQKAIKLS